MAITRKITQSDKDAAVRLKRYWQEHKARTGMTQLEAADVMGYKTQSIVASYLHCHAALGVGATLKFAKLLGVSPLDLRPDINDLLPGDQDGYLDEKFWRKCILMTEATLEASGLKDISGEKRYDMYMAAYRIMQLEDFDGNDTSVVDGVVQIMTTER